MTTASSPLQPSAGCVYCNYCPGYCCYRLKGSTLFITAEDINRLARHFGISDGEVRKRYLEGKNTFKTRDDGSCLFLSNARMIKRCSVHTARPRQCRDSLTTPPAPTCCGPIFSSRSSPGLNWPWPDRENRNKRGADVCPRSQRPLQAGSTTGPDQLHRAGSTSAGRYTRTIVPVPGLDQILISPWCRRTMA